MNDWSFWVQLFAPATLVGLILYVYYNRLIEQLMQLKYKEVQGKQEVLPQKLQAYERMALFLERIKPTGLVRRIHAQGTKGQFELELIHMIQEEWDHNLSQQIYVNPETWKIVFSAKNATQNFVKKCSDFLPNDADAVALRDEVIMRSVSEPSPSNDALLRLQIDIQQTT